MHLDKPASGQPVTPVSPLTVSTPLGRVVSITGSTVIVLLENDSETKGRANIGALVKIIRPTTVVFGLIEGLTIPIPSRPAAETDDMQLAELILVGEIQDCAESGLRRFRRGVSNMPLLNDIVLESDSYDTAAIYAVPDRQMVAMGVVHQDPLVQACVALDDTLGRHFAIVGSTGSGKSCALALLLHGLIEKNPHGHVLLLDPHGEYGQAFGDYAVHLTVDRLQFPYWILNFEETVEIFFGAEKDSMAAEIIMLRQLILKAKLLNRCGLRDVVSVNVDTPVPYMLSDILRLIDEEAGKLDNRSALTPYLKLKARLAALQADPRYKFMFPNAIGAQDTLATLLRNLFRIPTEGKPLCILDLVGVPTEVLNVVVAVLSRLAFDLAIAIGNSHPLLLICEEAHRYAPQDPQLGFEPAKRALARIAKEGRKYGISLGVMSQRPSDLAVSILSQCSTVFAFRMVNEADQHVIHAALSDSSSPLVNSLPLLGTGQAVIFGEGVPIPVRVRVSELPIEKRPRGNSAQFSKRWQENNSNGAVLDRVVAQWRQNNH